MKWHTEAIHDQRRQTAVAGILPKATKGQECIVKPERVPATFEYIGHLLDKVFLRRQLYPSLRFNLRMEILFFGYKADEPELLTKIF